MEKAGWVDVSFRFTEGNEAPERQNPEHFVFLQITETRVQHESVPLACLLQNILSGYGNLFTAGQTKCSFPESGSRDHLEQCGFAGDLAIPLPDIDYRGNGIAARLA